MDLRPHDTTQQGQSSMMMRHGERSMESDDKRQGANPIKRVPQDENRPIRRLSPSRPRGTGAFRPGFRGRFFRSRFIRDERTFRKPGFNFGFQRYNNFNSRPRAHWRDQLGPPAPNSLYPEQRNQERSSTAMPKDRPGTPKSSTGTSREREKEKEKEMGMEKGKEKMKKPLSFTVSRENKGGNSRERERERDLSSSVSRAAARNRAIQKKRREIEEVYRQDCDVFGVVVKMLIAKDPGLEQSIQSSLQDNLRDIGVRCVEAMTQFIEEYDAKEPSPK